METVLRILKEVLITLYQPFWFALIMAVLMLFFYMFSKEMGLKKIVRQWCNKLKTESRYRVLLVFFFYFSMILFKTLLNRDIWLNPLIDVLGVWSLYREDGAFNTEFIENIAMFVPFSTLTFMVFKEKLFKDKVRFLRTVVLSVEIGFLFSLSIELLQLFWRVGTFQLSDLFFNTIGSLAGGILYYIGHILYSKQKKMK